MLVLDSETMDLKDQLRVARDLPAENLLQTVASYNWDMYPAEVLGAIADRPDCSLLTALTIFDFGGPENYDLVGHHEGDPILALLQRIHDRVNTRQYTHDPEDHARGWQGLGTVSPFVRHRVEGRRWHLDPGIVLPAWEMPDRQKRSEERKRAQWLENHAQKHFACLCGNPRARRMAELALPLCHEDIQRRVDELMLEQGFPASIKWRFSRTRRLLKKRLS